MPDTKKPGLDDAHTGGGIGDIPPQAQDEQPSSVQRHKAQTDVDSATAGVEGVGLATDDDAVASGEDPDDDADSTLGQTP